jgi:hypothetical protein
MISLLQQSLERELQSGKLHADLSKHTANSGADSQAITELANSLEPFLRSIFNGLNVATRLSKHPQFGRAVAFATGQIVQYCFDEEDLFPEQDYGILGLLDDAYLIHRFVNMLQEMYSHVEMENVGYRVPEKSTFQLVRALLPAGVCDALDRTSYNLIQVSNNLFASGTRDSSSSFESFASLRIDEALSVLGRKVHKEG